MAIIVPTGYGQARLVFQLNGRPAPYVCTFGILAPGDFPNTIASDIRACFIGTGRPFAAGNMGSQYTFQGVDITQMTSSGPQLGSALTAVTGTASANSLPPNSSMLFRKNTSRGGRKGRGRFFLPPLHFDEGGVDALGNITGTLVASTQALWNSAMAAWLSTGYPPYLLHEDGSSPNAITSVTLQGTLATQRRRLR